MSATTSSSILCVPTLSQRQHQQQQHQQQPPLQQPDDAITHPLSAAIRETLTVLQQRLDCGSPVAAHVDDRSSSANNLFFQGSTGDCAAPFRYADDLSDSSTIMLDSKHGIEQLRRLSSWGTYGTINSADLISQSQYTPLPYPQYDDNGKPIDPVIFERALEHRRRRSHSNNSRRSNGGRGRPKTVKFAYPPITSLRQCPRHDDPELMADLFFTSSELDQYEEDRRQTTMVDDVEIVAVSTSSLSRDEGSANGEEDASYSNNKFGRYVPSPTKKGKQRHGSKGGSSSYATSGTGSIPAPTLSGSGSAFHKQQLQQQQQQLQQALPPDQQQQQQQQQQQSSSSATPQLPASTSPKRLLKSVQIFLRERSTGNV